MSTTPTESATPEVPAAQPTPPTTPEPDWKAEARKWEQRAKDNKDAADKLTQLEEASKSELQKALDRTAKAEKERDDLKAADQARQERETHAEQVKKWAEAAAKKTGVPAEALKGDTEEEIKAHADLLASLMPRKGYVANEGERPKGDGTSELRGFTRQLFNPDK